MANEANKMDHLKVGIQTFPDIDKLFNIQASLQSFVADRLKIDDIGSDNLSIGQRVDWLLRMKHAFDDEFSEMMDAMGGIDDGKGPAGWKWWKGDNKDIRDMHLSDLSEHDLKELKFEYVDMLHFFVNMGILLQMNGSEIMNMYLSKNAENIERQKNNY